MLTFKHQNQIKKLSRKIVTLNPWDEKWKKIASEINKTFDQSLTQTNDTKMYFDKKNVTFCTPTGFYSRFARVCERAAGHDALPGSDRVFELLSSNVIRSGADRVVQRRAAVAAGRAQNDDTSIR